MPDATPLLPAGALLIMALLFGVWNRPQPRPVTIIDITIYHNGVAAFKKLSRKSPAAITAIPAELKRRVSNRSEIYPAMGATSSIVSGMGAHHQTTTPSVLAGANHLHSKVRSSSIIIL
jgi:hypothetical protein